MDTATLQAATRHALLRNNLDDRFILGGRDSMLSLEQLYKQFVGETRPDLDMTPEKYLYRFFTTKPRLWWQSSASLTTGRPRLVLHSGELWRLADFHVNERKYEASFRDAMAHNFIPLDSSNPLPPPLLPPPPLPGALS